MIWETLRAVFDSTRFRGLLGEVSRGCNQVNHSFSSRILKIAKITIDEKESLKEEEEEKQKNIFKKGFCVQRNHCATIRLTYYCREAIHSCSTIANNSSHLKPQYEAESQSKNPNYASQPEAPTIVPDLCQDRFVCGVTAIVFSGGGADGLESRDEGATGSGQWEAIYRYRHTFAPVATVVNS